MKNKKKLIENYETAQKELFNSIVENIKEQHTTIENNYSIGLITYLESIRQLNDLFSSELKLIKNYKLEKFELNEVNQFKNL